MLLHLVSSSLYINPSPQTSDNPLHFLFSISTSLSSPSCAPLSSPSFLSCCLWLPPSIPTALPSPTASMTPKSPSSSLAPSVGQMPSQPSTSVSRQSQTSSPSRVPNKMYFSLPIPMFPHASLMDSGASSHEMCGPSGRQGHGQGRRA